MISKTFLITSILLIIVITFSTFLLQQYNYLPDIFESDAKSFFVDEEEAILEAVQKAVQLHDEASLIFTIYETKIEDINISKDGQWATAWLIPIDPDTKQIIPAEPGLAIVQKNGRDWLAVLPSEDQWVALINLTPDDLIPTEMKSIWVQIAEAKSVPKSAAPYRGYYLPWKAGETMALTQSVGHDRYTPSGSAHYAFDFAKVGYPSGMFDVHAAGFGTVKQAVWKYPNGDPQRGNYLVLEDTSTIPTTYQLYLHFAQNSIPTKFREVGAFVTQGDFIGVADDTGISSGNHLHFHVHTYPYSYWGTSVDIVFEDVEINGGRPRIPSDLAYCKSSDVCDDTQNTYVSKNTGSSDHTPPYGGFDNPKTGDLISASNATLAGWALDDDSGISSAQFKAKYNGTWHYLGEPFNTNTFVYDWNMCDDQVPDGPVSLALVLKDHAYNQVDGITGLTHFTKNYNCPSGNSPCLPSDNQAAVYDSKNFLGDCMLLDIGSYNQADINSQLGNDQTTSIKVGKNVQATLFANDGYTGRGETYIADDSNLSDNRIGKNSTSSVKVEARTTTPSSPSHIYPANNTTFNTESSFSLAWSNTGGGLEFKAQILKDSSVYRSTDWQEETFWHVNCLESGAYTWQVKARNGEKESPWSSTTSFNIENYTQAPPSSKSVPFTDTMENGVNGWTFSANWSQVSDANHTTNGTKSWRYHIAGQSTYNNGSPNSGYLISPPIQIPASGENYLRFWYQYETEDDELNWDQRWVQIAVDGESFTNILQLSDDAKNYWLRSKAISLASFAGETIRVRFYFATLDNIFNDFKGWYIDDFSITSDAEPDCSDTNDNIEGATLINYGDVINAVICPSGDIDFYQFEATKGDRIAAWIEAQSNGSPLDSYLFFYDEDGKSLLTQNDDMVTGERKDSNLFYQLGKTGTYFLKIRAWDSPTSGGTEYTYTLHLNKDSDDPSVSFVNPKSSDSLESGMIELEVAASDSTTGISRVQFFWHNSDWLNSDWIKIGEDWQGNDGWKISYMIPEGSDLSNCAFYAIAYDYAGNYLGTGAWNLGEHSLPIYLPVISK